MTNLADEGHRTDKVANASLATGCRPAKVYESSVLLSPEDEGGFSAFALDLPGVISQGDTVEEALENIRDAFRESIAYYLEECGGQIPWGKADVEHAGGCIERRISVHV